MKGLGNMGNLMKQAKKLQSDLKNAQEKIAKMRIQSSAGGGMVTATVNGKGKLLDLDIEKEVVDPEDIEMLIDLVVAAVQQAQSDAKDHSEEELGPLTQGLNLPGMAS